MRCIFFIARVAFCFALTLTSVAVAVDRPRGVDEANVASLDRISTRLATSFPPGFKAILKGRRAPYVECFVSSRVLSCLVYGGRGFGKHECGFGGTIPTVRMKAGRRARRTFTCVDEGYHGWRPLRVGRRFRERPFICRHVARGRTSVLRCRGGGTRFTITAQGRMRRR